MNECFETIFKQSSSIGFISGKRDSGKTDLALLLMERGKKEGLFGEIASNVTTRNDSSITYICYMDRLKEWLRLPGKKAFFLDELGKHLYKMRFMSTMSRTILEICQLVRKYDAHFIGAAPSADFVNKLFFNTDILDYLLKKLSRRKAVMTSYVDDFSLLLEDIPRTKVKFLTKDIAIWEMNDPKKDQEEFEGMSREEKAEKLYLIHKDLRTPAKILGVSHQTIANWIDKRNSKYKNLQVSSVK